MRFDIEFLRATGDCLRCTAARSDNLEDAEQQAWESALGAWSEGAARVQIRDLSNGQIVLNETLV